MVHSPSLVSYVSEFFCSIKSGMFLISVHILQVCASCVVLFFSAEYLLRGILVLSKYLKVSTTFLAITVVAFGTSIPELAACIVSAIEGHPNISVGNIMGSNLFNLLVVVGFTYAVKPGKTETDNLTISWIMLLVSTAIFTVLGLNLQFSTLDALIMVAVTVAITYVFSKTHTSDNTELDNSNSSTDQLLSFIDKLKPYMFVILGITGIVLGSKFAIDGAIKVGELFGISDRVIGLTIISVGTSIPELITSIVAMRKGYHNIALANVVGSNIMNTIGITGMTALVTPIVMNKNILSYDLVWVSIVTILMIASTYLLKGKTPRVMGIGMLLLYIIYITTLI